MKDEEEMQDIEADDGMSDDFVDLPPGEGDIDPEQFLPPMMVARRRWADVIEDDDDLERWTAPELSEDLVGTIMRGASRELEPKERVRRLCSIAGAEAESARRTVTELFSPPRVNAQIRAAPSDPSAITAGTSFDLTVDRTTGESWDFLRADHRRRCWARLKAEDPWVVIGSLPCTADQALTNRGPPPSERQARQMTEARLLLGFALSVYTWQVRRGRYFLHEHPASASSWKLEEVQAVRCLDGVTTMTCDACMFGMRAVDADGVERPVKKPTRWMSNAPRLLCSLGFRCDGKHAHTRLLGGRAGAAAVYPPEMVVAIVRGLQAQREEDARTGRTEAPLSAALTQAMSLENPAWSDKVVRDEYTGEPLSHELVRRGKAEELKHFKSKNVWREVPRSRAAGKRVVGTRWVCSNKGDEENPEVRCRLVCQEVKTYQSEEFFAATPPVESLRLIMSMAAEDPEFEVTLVDISRAYFNASIEREVFVELPPEAGRGKDVVGLLVKCMYGTRDAAQGWEGTYRTALESMSFRRGRASPCVFHHATRRLYLTVRGDDFFATGRAEDREWFEKTLLGLFEGKVKGRLVKSGDELRLLNRVVRRTEDGYEWEADQRHAELLIAGLGLAPDSKPLTNPGRKLTAKELDAELVPLDGRAATEFRAMTARANFLASDRPDIAFAVKELCRAMSSPTTRDSDALKRLARYLLGRPRLIMHFGWQDTPGALDVYTDSDWAGCVRTRKSTSGGAVLRGRHVLKTWSGTQATIALSSAEAELIALVKGAAEGLALRSLIADLGEEFALRVHVDSSAATGICRKTGVGKIRYLDTRLLWAQELVREKVIEVIKVSGEQNPADLVAKHLGADAISAHLVRLSCWERSGRAKAAPRCG